MDKLMNQIPDFTGTGFLLCSAYLIVVATVYANKGSKKRSTWVFIMIGLLSYSALQYFIAESGIYRNSLDSLPPKIFLFGILPGLVLILLFLRQTNCWRLLNALPVQVLLMIHLVRIPVELLLHQLYLSEGIPEIMTYTGFNFDILSGLFALVILFKPSWQKGLVWLWYNRIALALLLIIIALSVLSAPFPLQQLAMDQPNWAFLYEPYSLLATFIVPVVLLAHFIALKQLRLNKK